MKYENFGPLMGDWGEKMRPFIEGEDFDKIYDFLKFESRRGKKICPVNTETYRAFKETPFNDLKVVWLLQDPYPWFKNGEIVADGIAMSCSHTKEPQPSLEIFYDAIEDCYHKGLGLEMLRNQDLKYLCNQGVMMLNTALTCELNKSDSHTEIWKPWTKYLIEEVLSKYENGLIFVLSGGKSQYFEKYINPLQHYIFKTEHPAFAARKMRKWDYEGVFKMIDKILWENKKVKINWDYESAPF
jgi:uracil-DNA glycosylase